MPSYDFSAPRLYLDLPFEPGAALALDKARQNYLGNVLRLSEGGTVLIFNGRQGEWTARVVNAGRRQIALVVDQIVRPQVPAGDLHYVFAPLKHARLDYVVQKAVEMGASHLRPVQTRRTQVTRVNGDRMRSNVIEAAEQCGLLALPQVNDLEGLSTVLETWPEDRLLVFCDEDADGDPLAALPEPGTDKRSLGVLIGPEGGFDPAERESLLAHPSTVRISLGPRILRADTAAVAALALLQARLGDWR